MPPPVPAMTRFASFNFRVEIDGLTVGAFQRGHRALRRRRRRRVPRRHRRVRYRPQAGPGFDNFPNITLKRGYTTNRELWDWYRNIANGIPDRVMAPSFSWTKRTRTCCAGTS